MAEKMAKAIDGFYPYFWHKFKLSPGSYTEGPQCEKWVKDLREAVLVHGIVSLWQWRPFLDKILLKNRFSFKTYTSYTFFIISTTVEDFTRHESFMTSCSLVTAIAAYVHDKGHHDFLEYCPDILMVIFEEKYLKKPDGIQIWEKLEDHLNQYKYSEAYKMVEQTIEGNPFENKVYKLEFVTNIKEKIGSKISIENAAVYCQIAKVEKRFRTRKSQKLSFIEDWERKISVGEESTSVVKVTGVAVSKSNSSSHTEYVEETEILGNKQSFSAEKENDYINSRQISLQSEQTLQNDTNALLVSHSEESPLVHPIPVITTNRSSPFQMEPSSQNVGKSDIKENEQSLSVEKENVDINSKQISTLQSEQTLQNDTNALLVSHSEESPVMHRIPVITSHRSSLFQREPSCQNAEKPNITENKKSLRLKPSFQNVEEAKIPDINSKQISLQLEQTPQNDTTMLIMPDSEESSVVYRIPVITSNCNSPFQMEPSCQNMEKPNIPESVQRLSVTEEHGDNGKQRSSFVSEQLLLNVREKLGISENEQSIPVKSSVENVNSGDGSSQLETEIATEGSYSDIPHHLEATHQNTKLLLNEMELLKTSENKRSTPVKSSVENFNFGEESSRLETAIATEGNYSDVPHDSEATDSNKRLLNDRERLEPSDSKEITCVKSSVDDLNSGGENSRLETENIKEGNYSDIARDSETTDQDTAQQLQGKKRNKKSKKSKKDKEISGKNRSYSKLECSEVASLKISSHPEKQSLQTIEKPMDTEESLPVPSIDDVYRAYLFLEEKFKDSFRSVCDLLRIHITI